ncbi:hypothetical protein [Streptomyces griseorubiginosus]|uniref:Uncharacterized protein n=1 Tax=Streptomyces griseorubiginosus TaxID=67304 RepID=A0A101RMS3_9ACTN|nr:hypothetical protein [Streptomyces griseorubiginosus]KUN58446.1 hypothetical protein AQJ54_42025 [Streptomyces griseorubiginosus]
MTATPDTSQPTAHAWLAAAEAAHQEQQNDTAAQGLERARRHADLINARLADLGITPIEAARVDDRGHLRQARLTQPEYEPHTYYEVRAAWSENDKQVELHTADWEDNSPTFGRVRLLNSLADVAAARRETPTLPTPRRNYHQEAIRAIDSLNVDHLNNPGAEAVATAIHGATAALLHLADTIAREQEPVR